MNRLNKVVNGIKRFTPSSWHVPVISVALGSTVKLAGTCGLRFDELTPQQVQVSMKNSRRVQNHIGQIHACGMALLAETATGFCVGMNLPDSKLPLLKSMNIDYVKRSKGAMKAVARLSEDDVQRIQSEDKGEVTVPVTVTDEVGTEPIIGTLVWAWVPKKK